MSAATGRDVDGALSALAESRTDPDAMIQRRRDPTEPSAATVAAEQERRRLEIRRSDERRDNRLQWIEHYRTVAARLRGRAAALEDRARRLEAGGAGR